jgi:hypothetical protein
MAAGRPAYSLDENIACWHALAMRRHAYYLDLLRSGRWQHYFDDAQFAERLRDVVASTRMWDALAKRRETQDIETRSAA